MTRAGTPTRADRDALFGTWAGFARRLAARHHPRDPDAAADLAQDILLAALRRFPSFDPARSSFPNWLAWVARGTAHRYRTRAAGRRAVGLPEALIDPRAADPAAEAAAADEAAAAARLVRSALPRLPPRERAAVAARFGLGGTPAKMLKDIDPGRTVEGNRRAVARGLARLAEGGAG